MRLPRRLRGVVRAGRSAARRWVRRGPRGIRRGPGRRTPRLSVVVPTYDVRNYLAACLDSVLAQSFGDFEVIVVDDGSADGTPELVAEYVRSDPRVRLLVRSHRGVGAARNEGVRHATGELLTFVDGDDVVPARAFELMVRTLDESGSDFVVGSVRRILPDGQLLYPPWLRRLHRDRRLSVDIDAFPQMLADVFVWNKVFRRGFWDAAGLSFLDAARYEDQVLTTRAYLAATSFDVIRRPVYHWRVRADGSSLTQRRHEHADLRDRMDTKRMSLRLVQERQSPELLRVFYNLVLCMDLPVYFRQLLTSDDEYWRMLHHGMAELWQGAPPFTEAQLAPASRVLAWFVARGRRESALAVAEAIRQHPAGIPLVVRGAEVLVDLPFLGDPAQGVPSGLYVLREQEIPWTVELQQADIVDGVLTVRGRAAIERTASAGTIEVSGALVAGDAPPVPLLVEAGPEGAGSFVARVELERLPRSSRPREGPVEWSLKLRTVLGELVRVGPFNRLADGACLAGSPADRPAGDGGDEWAPTADGALLRFGPVRGLLIAREPR